MKKLMIAAAIVCAAAISHGAQLSWGITGIGKTPDSSGPANGAVCYFMDGSTYDAFLALAPEAVGAFCATNKKYETTAVVATRSTNATGRSGEYAAGANISGYTVLFDTTNAKEAGYYAYTELLSVTVPDAGNAQLEKTFANTSGWKEIPNVPEPTSGLLLLIGVAGLALKRRRA